MQCFFFHPVKKTNAGFTLIEVLVTVSILSVLLTLAAPSLQDFFIKNNMRRIADDFNQSIFRAKNTAVSKNTCTMMCMSSSTEANAPSCDSKNDTDWQAGWIVFLNPSCDVTKKAPESAEDMLEIRSAISGEYYLQAQSKTVTIPFNARGMNGLTSAAEFDLHYKSSGNKNNEKFGMNICLDALGRTRTIPSLSKCSDYK